MEIYIGVAVSTILIIIVVLIAIKFLGDMLNSTQKQASELQDKKLAEFISAQDKRFSMGRSSTHEPKGTGLPFWDSPDSFRFL